MQKNNCCTFITFLNKLHFCNSKNKKKKNEKKRFPLNKNPFLKKLHFCNSKKKKKKHEKKRCT